LKKIENKNWHTAGGIPIDFKAILAEIEEYVCSGGKIFVGTDSQIKGDVVVFASTICLHGNLSNRKYATYFFTQGAVASGEQAGLTTETDRDILAKSDAMAIDLHYCYHPVGAKWATTDTNPTRSVLETVGKWSKVYETKNIGIVRATNISTQD